MASPRLVVDGNTSRAAIMINSDPGSTAANIADPAFVNPLGHFGSWKWAGHPAVDYLGIISVKTGSVNLQTNTSGWVGDQFVVDARGVKTYLTFKKALANHGQSYIPMIVGSVTIGGHALPACGEFFAPRGTRFNIYADTTTIWIYADRSLEADAGSSGTASFALYVTNMGITSGGALVRPPLNVGWSVTGNRLRCGRFDTNYGYFYKNAAGAIPIFRGPSVNIGIGSLPSNSATHALGYSYNVNGYAVTKFASRATTDDTGTNWPGTSTAAASIVKVSAAMPAALPGFQASAGRLRFGNVLDTNRSMFLISNAILNKTITVPAKNWSNTAPVDSTTNFLIGNVHPNATDVLGLYTALGKTRSIGGTSVVDSGTYGMKDFRYQIQSGQQNAFAACHFFYFSITGGQLIMTVKSKFPLYPPNDGHFASFSIKVNALVGAFDY